VCYSNRTSNEWTRQELVETEGKLSGMTIEIMVDLKKRTRQEHNVDELECSVYSMKRTRKKDAITSVLSIANEKN
jgi:hypothetical protein